jgi:uncharacterized protein (TIGR03000 family)
LVFLLQQVSFLTAGRGWRAPRGRDINDQEVAFMTRSRSLLAALLIAGTVLTLAPSISSAQFGRRWGGGMGTGYYGGGYGNYGNSWGGYYGSGWGYDRGYYPSYGYSNYGYYNPGLSLNWNSYPAYSGYPMYSSDYSYPSYSGYYGNPGFYGSQGMRLGSPDYQYGSLSEDMKNRAFLNVRLPSPDAEVWVEGDKTRSTGQFREFMSPPLDPDKKYSYEIKARWMENGKEVTRTKKVSVRPNAPTMVDFTAADRDDKDRSGTDKDRTPETDKDRTKSSGSDRPDTDKKLPLPDPDKKPPSPDK